MLTNPASALLEMFELWQQPANASPQVSRRLVEAENEGIDAHLQAMCLLAAMKRSVDELERSGYRVGAYRRSFRLWTKAVLNYPHAWNSNSNPHVFTDHAMDTLDNLAAAIDNHLPNVEGSRVKDVARYLDEITELLGADDTLSRELRLHITKILDMVRRCMLEESSFGETDLRQALYDLWISLYAAAGQTGDGNRRKWAAMAETIFKPATAGFLGSVPSVVLAAAQLTQSAP